VAAVKRVVTDNKGEAQMVPTALVRATGGLNVRNHRAWQGESQMTVGAAKGRHVCLDANG
jgi:hypothetical protein